MTPRLTVRPMARFLQKLASMNATTVSERTPALVVGAGPVGLVAAIGLRLAGARVRVIDDQPLASKRTYPVVLH